MPTHSPSHKRLARLVGIDPPELLSARGHERLDPSTKLDGCNRGDWVWVEGSRLSLATPNRTPERSLQWMEHTLDPARRQALLIRDRVESGIHEFFRARDFIHTRTPLLVPCPGMETHIRTFQTQAGPYLPTSPEFAMKRLLAGGLERIYQICPAFRLEPHSSTHSPEFTMLEWYRTGAGYEDIMRDTEDLIAHLASRVFGKSEIRWQSGVIDVRTPWPRLRVRDLFLEHAGVDLVRSDTAAALRDECNRLGLSSTTATTWDDLYFLIWLNRVEPRLPQDRGFFVTRYPASQCALAVIDSDSDGSRWARRFEVYAGGIELGNAFEELTDPIEQRARFVADMALRTALYGDSFPPAPIDESFLHALTEGMPPAGGIAVGVDRLVMLLANEPNISKTFWLDAERARL